MIEQTLIPVSVKDTLTLENFVVGENAALLTLLSSLVSDDCSTQLLYIWAESGAGKTHLLHGVCALAKLHRLPYRYFSLADQDWAGAMAESPADHGIVCIDNLEHAATDHERQVALLSLYERGRSTGCRMVVAATRPPSRLDLELKDLVSRLSSGITTALTPMADGDKRRALQQRAGQRGFVLNEQVMDYVMSRFSRDTVSLFALLDRMDRASLVHQRKITVPFVKQVLEG